MRVGRFSTNPIITPQLDDRIGSNINGPSLVRVPDWLPEPLGAYYLYFAHHKGKYIRMTYADDLEGPWTTYGPGVLDLQDSFSPTPIGRTTSHPRTYTSMGIDARFACTTMGSRRMAASAQG